MKRGQGKGSITILKDGRRWVRGPHPDRRSLGYAATDEEAEALLANPPPKKVGRTFAEVVPLALDDRELEGLRGVADERSVAKVHLLTAPFASKPLTEIDPTDIAAWLRLMQTKRSKTGGHLARTTIRRALAVASAVFVAAGPQGRGLVLTNPCVGMRVRSLPKTEEAWTFLTLDEQKAIRSCVDITDAERLAILFAVGTGLRQGEQFNLELADVHHEGEDPHVVVRFGSRGRPPKNGKIRTVPLFGVGLWAAKEWLRLLPSYAKANPFKLLFPSLFGHRRAKSKPLGNMLPVPCTKGGTHVIDGVREGHRERFVRVAKGQGTHRYVDRFELALRAAGITRPVRWHDLRHTTASALVSGFWGRAWTLPEVREMLGHSSVSVTERYAHLGDTALKQAARAMACVKW